MKRITLGLLVISVALILSSADRVAAQRHRGTAASRTPPTTECSANITNILIALRPAAARTVTAN